VLDVAARYSVADGGRTIDFPVGDLLNPVYGTLEELLQASGQPASLPRVRNEQITLLREREQETKLVLEQPLYEPRLAPGVAASREDLNRVEADLAALRSRVTRDAQQAYYQWLAAQQAQLVLEATRELAQANLDANESLYRNGRITRDLVYRAEADVLEVEQQRIAAASRVRIAQSYVNLLRNVPLATPLPAARPRSASRARKYCCSRIRSRAARKRPSNQRGRSRRASSTNTPARRKVGTSAAPTSSRAAPRVRFSGMRFS